MARLANVALKYFVRLILHQYTTAVRDYWAKDVDPIRLSRLKREVFIVLKGLGVSALAGK